MEPVPAKSRRGGGRRTRQQQRRRGPESTVIRPGLPGGRYRPLTEAQAKDIYAGALHVLERVGLAEPTPTLRRLALEAGAWLDGHDRLCLPRDLVEATVARAAHRVRLHGFDPAFDLEIGGQGVHLGVAGAAVQVLESDGRSFRDSTLADLHRLCRVAEASANIHYVLRPVIARDMATPLDLDLNTAYACLSATRKPIGTSFGEPDHVDRVVALFDCALGGAGRFRERPYCFASVCHVVPPLRFATEACLTLEAAVRAGLPLQLCSAGQAGATSPAALAGALVQGLAESLAGLVHVNLIAPGHPCILAFMPFISDLRSGAMTGGGGEGAVASAAAAQLLNWLDLPSTVSAGMTDAKLPDNQAGYEKGTTVTLAAAAGANMVNLSCGMLGSIMAASCEAMVIDDDMHGAILRAVKGVEVSESLLSLDVIAETVRGEGHYLGHAQTRALMERDFIYPKIGDRQSITDWLEAGGADLWKRARARVEEILSAPPPGHLDPARDQEIRRRFPIRLP